MDSDTLLKLAALNNAEWCDTICTLHNAPGTFTNKLWLNGGQVPMYYPNVVTLDAASPTEQYDSIKQLIGSRSSAWSVKDSFANLDLSPLGFNKLFDAEWLLMPEAAADVIDKWSIVDSEDTLRAWEDAWGNRESASIFKPELLGDSRIHFIAIHDGQELVAGAILNSSEQVVGISNIFYPAEKSQHYLNSLINICQQLYKEQPVIGYESGDELQSAKDAGFTPIGALNVWLKES